MNARLANRISCTGAFVTWSVHREREMARYGLTRYIFQRALSMFLFFSLFIIFVAITNDWLLSCLTFFLVILDSDVQFFSCIVQTADSH